MQCKLGELYLGSFWIEQLASVFHPSLRTQCTYLQQLYCKNCYGDPVGVEQLASVPLCLDNALNRLYESQLGQVLVKLLASAFHVMSTANLRLDVLHPVLCWFEQLASSFHLITTIHFRSLASHTIRFSGLASHTLAHLGLSSLLLYSSRSTSCSS